MALPTLFEQGGADMNAPAEPDRRLSRTETHDLSMIIKDRTKVLRAHVEEQAAKCLADFETKLAARFSFTDDAVWEKATAEATRIVAESTVKIVERCIELGIPKEFAPGLDLSWHGRGENAFAHRRGELTRVAKAQIDAMSKSAIVKIERQSLDLRTQVVAMGVLSADAKLFLESLAPVEEAMRSLDFKEVETKMLADRSRRQDGY